MATYGAIIQKSLNSALCESRVLLDPPRTDVFKALFDPFRGMPAGWHQYVLPYLPEDETAPVPPAVLRSACDLLFPSADESKSAAHRATLTSHRKIFAANAETGEPLADFPIRVVWRDALARPDTGNDISQPMRSIVARTDSAGLYDLEIDPEMVTAQAIAGINGSISYVVIPYSSHHIVFAWVGGPNVESCGKLLNSTMGATLGGAREWGFENVVGDHGCERGNASRWTATTTAQHGEEGTQIGDLAGIAARVNGRVGTNREGKFLHPHQFDPRNAGNLQAYEWRWPADALVARTYGLFDFTATVEYFPEALIELQREQINTAFERMCEEADEERVGDAYIVSRELWWVEAQTKGLETANESARVRAERYENGTRCFSRNGREPPKTPGRKPMSRKAACAIWQDVSPGLTNPSYTPQPSFGALPFDIQCKNFPEISR